ncbi:MAG: type II toxin-antitoxin system mRNA interferase toxin, RelE/StbE family [Candidatus Vogelbacteria bacterium]|nr:type II toxin-antitoxin system mRNA interferase toxin, RelE/StbE family [Candidatus Vogelbacteria bacterium]
MIRVIYHKNFKKGFKKLKISEQKAFGERIGIFMINPTDSVLNNHVLHGKYLGCHSINITGDLRVVFESISENIIHLLVIDTHSNLYK